MSWYASKNVASAEEVDRMEFDGMGDKSAEVLEQFETAKLVAKVVINSGHIGLEGKRFSISLSGHANPGHEPKVGYANDTITVNVRQLEAAKAPVDPPVTGHPKGYA